jgi:hypothetical protein
MSCPPILFLIFNRPDLTARVFERIRAAKPKRLFIAADGPRLQYLDEAVRCVAARHVVDGGIDWDCEVKTLYRDSNLGCREAVSSAILWFFTNVEHGIILEDDCLPDPSFFGFCSEMLAMYRDDSSVGHINGSSFAKRSRFGRSSYAFSKYPHMWGWATWSRAWSFYSFDAEWWFTPQGRECASKRCPSLKERAYWDAIFDQLRHGLLDTWDYYWTLTTWRYGLQSVYPKRKLVQNIGFRSDGTHTKTDYGRLGSRAQSLRSIRHPNSVVGHAGIDEDHFLAACVMEPQGLRKALILLRCRLGRFRRRLFQ